MSHTNKLTAIFLFLFGLPFLGTSQQLPLFEQYRNMGFVINPAMSGSEGNETVGLLYRYQWSSLPGAPQTGFVTYDTHRLMDDYSMAISGFLMHDRTGPTMSNGLGASYAYHIEIPSFGGESHYVSFGLQASVFQHGLNGEDLITTDIDDNLVIGDRRSAFLPEVGAGVFYYNEFMGFGVSMPQILGLTSKFTLDDQISPIQRERHIYGNVHGKIPIGYEEKNYLLPSIWAKYSAHAPLHLNINLKSIIDEKFLVGVGYSTANMVTGEFGLILNQRYKFGYSYSTQFTEWNTFLGDSHEIFFIYVIDSDDFGWY